MKIYFEFERLREPNTGLYEYCYQLGKNLIEIKSAEDQLCFFLPESKKDTFKAFGDTSEKIFKKDIHKIFSPKWGDVQHIAHQTSKYMALKGNAKKLLTIHDLNFLYEKDLFHKAELMKRHIQLNIDKADHIVAISDFAKQDVLTHLKLRGKPIEVIHNGCDVEVYEDFDEPTYRPKGKFIFSLGTIMRKKNFHVLPPLLVDNDLELLLGGVFVREYWKDIEEEAQKYGVADRVKLLGGISPQEKYWYYNNCEAFVFPSVAEGFGIPPIEAMRMGKPVFLSTRTSLPEVGGKHAYYFGTFDPDDMRRVFAEGMKDFAENNRRQQVIDHSMKFSWRKTAEQYYEVYKKLLAK